MIHIPSPKILFTSQGVMELLRLHFFHVLQLTFFMPYKKLDSEEWCCQYCQNFSDLDYDKVVYHEITAHHAGCPKKEK